MPYNTSTIQLMRYGYFYMAVVEKIKDSQTPLPLNTALLLATNLRYVEIVLRHMELDIRGITFIQRGYIKFKN